MTEIVSKLNQLLSGIGMPLREVGDSWRTACPCCGGSDEATKFMVDERGRFYCFACSASGSAYDLVMRITSCGFREAKALLGEVPATIQHFAKKQPRRLESELQCIWDRMLTQHSSGEAYLDARGLLDAAKYVRYRDDGAIAMRVVDGSHLIGIHYRILPPGDVKGKVRFEAGSSNYGLFITHLRGDTLIVCEGWADTLQATIDNPDTAVIGVPGVTRFNVAAEFIARHKYSNVLIYQHNDKPGIKAATGLLEGLPKNVRGEIVNIPTEFNDLNEWRQLELS